MPSTYSRPLVSYPPLSILYRLYAFANIAIRAPLYFLAYLLLPSWRPHPQWSAKQSTLVRVVRLFVDMVSTTEMAVPLPLTAGSEKDRFKLLEPYPSGFYRGPLVSSSSASSTSPSLSKPSSAPPPPKVLPVPIGGVWYPSPVPSAASLNPESVVFLHLHGGAFVMGDGRPAYMNFTCKTLLKHAGAAAVFAPSYRLSCRPGNDIFPAALQDTLTSYLYLTRTLGIPARQVVLSGDSAGAALVISFLRYLQEYGNELEQQQQEVVSPPLAAVLFSPFINSARCSGDGAVSLITGNAHFHSDMIPTSFPTWGVRMYCGDGRIPVDHPYVTPLGNPFYTPVPMFVNWGGAELLEMDGLQWTHEMASVEGNKLKVHHEAHAPHDTILLGNLYGFEESARLVARAVREFWVDVKKEQP